MGTPCVIDSIFHYFPSLNMEKIRYMLEGLAATGQMKQWPGEPWLYPWVETAPGWLKTWPEDNGDADR